MPLDIYMDLKTIYKIYVHYVSIEMKTYKDILDHRNLSTLVETIVYTLENR